MLSLKTFSHAGKGEKGMHNWCVSIGFDATDYFLSSAALTLIPDDSIGTSLLGRWTLLPVLGSICIQVYELVYAYLLSRLYVT